MGQKIRPTGFRTGIMVDWLSHWYANKQDFSDLLVEDTKIRKFVKKRYGGSGISKIRIQRTREKVTVFIHSARVGMIIGKKGQEVDKLTKDLEDLTGRHIEVKTMEVNRPEVDPQLVAEDIAEQLQKRASFRRTMKRAIDTTMEAGAKGVRIQMAGRLGGAEMARTESSMAGSIPLSTLRAKVEFGFAEAKTAQGHIGIKVWINNGDYLDAEETPEVDAQLVAEDIAEQLQKRASFRRTLKRAIDTTMEAGAKGVRIQLSGRLGGAEMARTESNMAGSIPLSTLRARIDYGFAEAKTAQGHIGIKVWINNGDYMVAEDNPENLPPRGLRCGRRAGASALSLFSSGVR